MATVCVDIGTSVIKAVAFDHDGKEVALARQETDVLRPVPGFSEQDMDSVWNATASTIREVVSKVTESVQLISLTAQGDGCWLVDSDGRPTGPAILWNDARAARIVDLWREAGVLAEAFRRNGSQVFSGAAFTFALVRPPRAITASFSSGLASSIRLVSGAWLAT